MTHNESDSLIPEKESMTVEFKSDIRSLPDRDLLAAVVCLANTDGGEIYLGVEDNGNITGLHQNHRNVSSLSAMIANKTNPPVSVRVTVIEDEKGEVARISVPKSSRLVATSEGLLQKRRMGSDGKPQCVPFYPHEFATRQSDLGILDYSCLPIREATTRDFDPLERERLRQLIERYGGDTTLLSLEDSELDGALGFVDRDGDQIYPTVTGLLLIGRESAIKRHIPAHEVAFQILEDTEVKINDFYRAPILKCFQSVMDRFEPRLVENEVQIGLFRVSVPNFDRRAFREAVVNAVIHRDYTRLGAVHIRWESEGITVSNPGGFVEGVNLENLLVVEPRPRNPRLADAIKRIGLAERTGRGVDLIFEGLLRYGRPAPDYSMTTNTSVVVKLIGGEADIGLIKVIVSEENRTRSRMPLESIIILTMLSRERRLEISSLAKAIQRPEAAARNILERLVEKGLIEGHHGRPRTYTLSSRIYRELGQPGNYVQQAGFDAIQQEEMIVKFLKKHKSISRKDIVPLCRINEAQASRLLKKLYERELITKHSAGRSTYYTLTSKNG